ncbi:VWA domain-containing protein [Pseudohaliea rubra]|uniref:Carbon monoxide dehydrogenase E protein n=1 Tax=Pseudohaliea rubra DSM 19751 TaxID=1265313 RepID=A0A095XWH0_9GAMM|nr:VWA domain-containing protein [Pseudohaliea rubra]KGE04036.1 carbon monoxide dehydrogenase E protein [Pseudohaliea rubra DSM 19751]
MDSSLVGFVRILRSHDLRVSPAETLDAMAAAEALGFGDRERLRDGLAATLVKSRREEEIFRVLFERYFDHSAGDFAGAGAFGEGEREGDGEESTTEPPPATEAAGDGQGGGASGESGESGDPILNRAATESDTLRELLASPLMQALLGGKRGELSARLRRAGRDAGIDDIRLFTQKGQYARRILTAMGEEQLRGAVIDLERREDPAIDRLRSYRDLLREQVRDYVDAQYLLHAEGHNRQFMDDVLAKTRLSNIEQHYTARVRELVQRMARKLASRHRPRQQPRRRGRLDMARTLRAGIPNDGVLMRTHWRQRRKDRAQVLALCDVSGSVAAYAKFLLIFLYSLQDVLPRMRSFAFSSHLGEVSGLFEEEPLERAVELVNWRYGGATDYGASLRDFARLALNDINRHTSVIILGDARNNRGDPELPIMQSIYQRSKQVIWLNPESRRAWGTGDSEMHRYLSTCHFAAECHNLRQLEKVVDQLLRSVR